MAVNDVRSTPKVVKQCDAASRILTRGSRGGPWVPHGTRRGRCVDSAIDTLSQRTRGVSLIFHHHHRRLIRDRSNTMRHRHGICYSARSCIAMVWQTPAHLQSSSGIPTPDRDMPAGYLRLRDVPDSPRARELPASRSVDAIDSATGSVNDVNRCHFTARRVDPPRQDGNH